MSVKLLGKFNAFEIVVYEMLGVNLFRKGILFLEKIKHHKDNKYNENYHPKKIAVSSFVSFSGYLMYNSMFHISSILLIAIYFAITWSLQIGNLWMNIFMCFAIFFNLYCIMLQRYIYLKIRVYLDRASTRRNKRIQFATSKLLSFLKKKDGDEILEEYGLLQRVVLSMTTGSDCVFGSDCAETLNRLAIAAEHAGAIALPTRKANIDDVSINQMLAKLTCQTELVGKIEQRVANLQRFLGRSKNGNVLFGYSIITEDSKCEEAFCRLFPVMSREKVEFTAVVLLTAYQKTGMVK